MATIAAPTWQQDLQTSARRLGRALWAGLIMGALIGGVGGRLAMFVLRLTSDPSLHGTKTDDEFIIGEFTSDTGFLILVTTAFGGLFGVLYLAVRPWLPQPKRPIVMAALGAVIGGAFVIHPGGVDFTRLEPLWLAVLMFVALPAMYGAAMSALTERWLSEERGPRFTGWLSALVPLVGLVVLGPVGALLFVVAVLGWAIGRKLPIHRLWTSLPVVWCGRVLLLAAFALGLSSLVADITKIL